VTAFTLCRTRRRRFRGRRRLTTAATVEATAGVAGCLSGGDGSGTGRVSPVGLGGERACDLCGMIVGNHLGVRRTDSLQRRRAGGQPPGTVLQQHLCTHLSLRRRRRRTRLARDVSHRLLARRAGGVRGEVGHDVSSHVGREALSSTTEFTVVARSEVAEHGGDPCSAEGVDRPTLEALRGRCLGPNRAVS